MELTIGIATPILQLTGKLMRFTSKFQVNNQTLGDLKLILQDLKGQVDRLWSSYPLSKTQLSDPFLDA